MSYTQFESIDIGIGDSQFIKLHRRYFPYVRKILSRFCSSNSIDDVCQETFVSIFRHLDQLVDNTKITYWIARVASRAGSRHLRRPHKRKESVMMSSDAASLFNLADKRVVDDTGLRDQIKKALESLSEEDRYIIIKICCEGYTSIEVAKELGLTDSSVRSKLFRARQSLKVYFNELGDASLCQLDG